MADNVEPEDIEGLIYSYVINLRSPEAQLQTFEQYALIVRRLGYKKAEDRIRQAKRMLKMVEG